MMKKIALLAVAVFTMVFATDNALAKKAKAKAITVTSTVKVEKGKKGKDIIFTNADGEEVKASTKKLDPAIVEAAEKAAESGEAIEIKFKAGKKGAQLLSVNGVKPAPKAKKEK